MSLEKQLFVTDLTEVKDADVFASDKDKRDRVGDIRSENGGQYKYIVYGGASVAAIAGQLLVYHGDDGYDDSEVSMDFTDEGIVPAGIAMAAMTNGQFGWIQIAGGIISTLAIAASVDAAPVAAADGDVAQMNLAIDGGFRRRNTVVDADTEVEQDLGIIIDANLKKILLTGLPV